MSADRPVRIFVVGSPRSGTTLVQSILVGHPGVWSLPETHFFPRVVPSGRRRFLGFVSNDAPSALQEVARLAGAAQAAPPCPPTLARYVRAFVAILDEAARSSSCDAWVEKTPDHLHHVAAIEKYVPAARFVHVVRDGADVVASVVAVSAEHPEPWGGRRSIGRAAAFWASDLAATARLAGAPNHLVVRYEQLIADGGALGRRWEQVGLSEPSGGDREVATILTAEEPWKDSVREGLFDGRGLRLDSLSRREREEILEATADGRRLLEQLWPLR